MIIKSNIHIHTQTHKHTNHTFMKYNKHNKDHKEQQIIDGKKLKWLYVPVGFITDFYPKFVYSLLAFAWFVYNLLILHPNAQHFFLITNVG